LEIDQYGVAAKALSGPAECHLVENLKERGYASPKLVSDEVKPRAINEVHQTLAARLGVDPELVGAKISFGLNSELPTERQHELAKAMGLQMAFESSEKLFASIRTEEDLNRAVQAFEAATEQAPTIARNVIEKIGAKLPRRGGPGRTPKLDPQESTMSEERF
jgi:hypothetical protein